LVSELVAGAGLDEIAENVFKKPALNVLKLAWVSLIGQLCQCMRDGSYQIQQELSS